MINQKTVVVSIQFALDQFLSWDNPKSSRAPDISKLNMEQYIQTQKFAKRSNLFPKLKRSKNL